MQEITVDAHEYVTAVIDIANKIHRAASYQHWSVTHRPSQTQIWHPGLYKLMHPEKTFNPSLR